MDRIIFFNGAPSSGKDFISEVVCNTLGGSARHLKFATPIIKSVREKFAVTKEVWDSIYLNPDRKEEKLPLFGNRSLRQVMIDVSEVHKEEYGDNIYAIEAYERALLLLGRSIKTVVFSDIGFEEELLTFLECIRPTDNISLELYRVHREGKTFERDSRKLLYPENWGDVGNNITCKDIVNKGDESFIKIGEDIAFNRL